jgi:hypothetical protein
VRQILDDKGRLRGDLDCGWDMFPLSATLFTRYAVISGVSLNFAAVSFERKGVQSIVIDRTTVNPNTPSTYSAPIHVNRLDLVEEAYPELKGMLGEVRKTWIDTNIPKDVRWNLVFHRDGSIDWLDANYRDWRDPAAYW